jgi:uncharacterized membrane protein YeaQ/YmgE (transglycosylase-associated protein family)
MEHRQAGQTQGEKTNKPEDIFVSYKMFFILHSHLIINAMNILLTLLFGAIAGWLAGFFVIKDKGGLIWNIIIGLLGGLVGGWLLGLIGAGGSFWSQWYGQIISAVIGAVVLLWVWNLIKKAIK